MRLAPTAMRWENGVVTGTSGADIRSKSGFTNPLYSQRDTDRVWVLDHEQVFTIWIVDVRARQPGHSSLPYTSPSVSRSATARPCAAGVNCHRRVTLVEAIFCSSPHGMEPAMPAPMTPSPTFSQPGQLTTARVG